MKGEDKLIRRVRLKVARLVYRGSYFTDVMETIFTELYIMQSIVLGSKMIGSCGGVAAACSVCSVEPPPGL